MRTSLAVAAAVIFLVSRCTTTATEPDVVVNVMGGCPPRSVVGAVVELRGGNGLIAKATSGIDGVARFPAKLLRRAEVMIACHEDYSCGAVQLEPGRAGQRYLIVLGPLMVSLRSSVPRA